MAAQEAPHPFDAEALSQAGAEGRHRNRLRLIREGELVSNAPLRARMEWLMEHDPDFTARTVCERLVDLGYPSFMRRRADGTVVPDGTHVLRLLGMRDQTATVKHGRRYEAPSRTAWVTYDMAVALARALDLDPVDAGV